MPYCTVEDVLRNNERITDTTDEREAIAAFIEFADGFIDDSIRHKVDLPFTVVPTTIRLISSYFATWMELKRLIGQNVGGGEEPEWVTSYREFAEEKLSAIAGCEIMFSTDDATQKMAVDSNTRGKKTIFDLGHPYEQDWQSTPGDKRYGRY